MIKRVLVVDKVHESLFEELKGLPVEMDYLPNITAKEAETIIGKYHGLVTNSKLKVNPAFLERATVLEFAIRAGSGMDIFDLEAAEKKGVKCFNTPEGNKDAVAEHALGFLLVLVNNICKANTEVRNGIWKREENRGRELSEMTAGIIGYGNNGSAFAQRLRAMGCRVLAYDKYKSGYAETGIEEVGLEEIYEQADILSLHIPLTEETKFLVNLAFIERFKRKIYLINCSRGKIVSISALKKAFEKGLLSGAALDVLENEKMDQLTAQQASDLKSLFSENTIFTPHIAGWTHESKRKISELIAARIKRLL
ncbi:MAG: NAD(P)-dependent oxidoreductase [Chitinophagales bacterium]